MTSVLSLQPSASLSFAPCKNTSQTNLSAQPFCHWPSSRGKTIGFYHWFLPSIIGPVNWPLNQFLYLLFDVGVPSFDAPFITVRALRGSFARFFLGFFSIAKKSAAWLLTGWLWWEVPLEMENTYHWTWFQQRWRGLAKTPLTYVYQSMRPGSSHRRCYAL